MSGVILNEKGERIIPGTRRPDGTFRKERKVREGYTPQEEQPIYQPRQAMAKKDIPLCPGMDNEEVLAIKNAAANNKGKSAKRNEKKQEKKKEDAVAGTVDKLQKLSTKAEVPTPAPAAKPAEPAPAPAADEPPRVRIEKEIRKLRKKIRECDALLERQSKGEALTEAEGEKVNKVAGWTDEIKQLEAECAALPA